MPVHGGNRTCRHHGEGAEKLSRRDGADSIGAMKRLARRRRRPAVVALIGALLLAPVATPGAVPVPSAASVSPAVAEAWTLLQTFHEDLNRIDRARDLLEQELVRQTSLEAL